MVGGLSELQLNSWVIINGQEVEINKYITSQCFKHFMEKRFVLFVRLFAYPLSELLIRGLANFEPIVSRSTSRREPVCVFKTLFARSL